MLDRNHLLEACVRSDLDGGGYEVNRDGEERQENPQAFPINDSFNDGFGLVKGVIPFVQCAFQIVFQMVFAHV